MHAQVVQGGTTPGQRDEMNRIVHEMLIPALEAENGFVGALNIEDRESGHGMMSRSGRPKRRPRRCRIRTHSARRSALSWPSRRESARRSRYGV